MRELGHRQVGYCVQTQLGRDRVRVQTQAATLLLAPKTTHRDSWKPQTFQLSPEDHPSLIYQFLLDYIELNLLGFVDGLFSLPKRPVGPKLP